MEIGTNILVYTVCGTLIFIAAGCAVIIYVKRRQKLNWFEKSVLEISKGNTEYIHCGRAEKSCINAEKEWIAYDRKKMEHACDSDTPRRERSSARRQSRIYVSDIEMQSLAAIAGMHASSSDRCKGYTVAAFIAANWSPSLPSMLENSADFNGEFYVPTKRDTSLSMFHGVDMKKIDPCLYENKPDTASKADQIVGQCGSLQMALKFDSISSVLLVKLLRCSNLRTRLNDGAPNAYFKIQLIPPNISYVSQIFESKHYLNVRSTNLDDEFEFNIPDKNLRDCQLEILVYDLDEIASTDECIGCCYLSLNRVQITEIRQRKITFWAEILPLEANDEENLGEIMLSISYTSKNHRLSLNILKARNLINPTDASEPPDAYVKFTLYIRDKKLKHGRTCTKKASYNPTFDEIFAFTIAKDSLADLILGISICHDSGPFRHSKILGRLEIPIRDQKDIWLSLMKEQDPKAAWFRLK